MDNEWPENWSDRISGRACEMCRSERADEDSYGIRIFSTDEADAMLQRADIQRGYTIVIWRGRHVVEPFELTESEAASYWKTTLTVAKALAAFYRPLKINYETLGNTVPHLHTHLLPRFVEDPAPGMPFPLRPQSGDEARIDPALLASDAAALRALLEPSPGS